MEERRREERRIEQELLRVKQYKSREFVPTDTESDSDFDSALNKIIRSYDAEEAIATRIGKLCTVSTLSVFIQLSMCTVSTLSVFIQLSMWTVSTLSVFIQLSMWTHRPQIVYGLTVPVDLTVCRN